LGGCKKDDNEKDMDTGSAVDNAFAQGIYDDVSNMSDQAAQYGALTTYRNGAEGQSLLSQCATVTIDTTISPREITIDFGTTNCLCLDGRYRRGKILVSYLGGYRDSGSVHTISFDDYYVNDYNVAGSKTVTNMGANSSGNKWFSINVTGTITAPGGQVLSWTSQRQREWVAGEPTIFNWTDDVYHITGTASGTSFAGVNFSAIITSPLVVALDCWWIKEGVLEFSPAGVQTRVIDYGHLNGNCDRLAQVTIGNNTYIVELR
jgi:hypothetical protein